MRGLLLVNLGTPDAPTRSAVRRYLKEFLSDPRVIDINPVGRALLLNLIILPFRSGKSAELYKNIWADRGSPLLFHSEDLRDKVAACLGDRWHVELAMRYGKPNIADAMDRLQEAGCDEIVLFALYPQTASSTTGSTVEKVYEVAKGRWNVPYLSVVPAFYDHPGFIEGFVAQGRALMDEKKPDHVLFSFHGLPERHLFKGDTTGAHCLKAKDCCATISDRNRGCYRAQCFATAKSIASGLGLDEATYSVGFQSRLGRDEWIKPYIDDQLPALAKDGVKKLLVYSPAFVADCLETLEELELRAAETWHELGGEELTLVPSLNSSDSWAATVASIARANSRAPWALPTARDEAKAS